MKIAVVGVALGVLFGGPALAQSNSPQPEPPQIVRPVRPQFGYDPRIDNAEMDRVRLSKSELQNWPTSNERRERRQRMERAGRLADLVNQGRCHDAHSVALSEGDRAMANRIASVCRGES